MYWIVSEVWGVSDAGPRGGFGRWCLVAKMVSSLISVCRREGPRPVGLVVGLMKCETGVRGGRLSEFGRGRGGTRVMRSAEVVLLFG